MSGFPFSAIVGQEPLKRALLLAVIQPQLGGVLIRGTKGVAKSTAVRALAALLPPIETVADCPFQRAPGQEVPDWPLPPESPCLVRPVPLVELPLGATEDRVLGSLHLEKALRGERALEPGLLAAANRGLLYVDEVNLLPDHLVDVLLDASAGGVHRLEREGLSLSHPARFVLIGTMNPEEGDLRPQLLDRFGLVVDVADLADPADRAEAVRRRLAFEADPDGFIAVWREADRTEAERVARACDRVRSVRVPDELLRAISERCLAEGVEGLRADLTVCRAACAWAAYHYRSEVTAADVEAVAELALAHRRTRPPQPPPNGQPQRERPGPSGQREQPNHTPGRGAPAGPTQPGALLHFESAGVFSARKQLEPSRLERGTAPGRRRPTSTRRYGPAGGGVRGYQPGDVLSWAATLRAAALDQGEPGRVQREDLRGWRRRGPAGCLLLFLVDASGSMAAWQRMRQTKAVVLSLLLQAYHHRDRVALLAFRGPTADLVLPPVRGLTAPRRALEELAVGGATPLAHGLAAAARLVRTLRRRQPQLPTWTVLLTDGRTNVPLCSEPWADALNQARNLAACGTRGLVVDTETGNVRFGRARQLAAELQAECWTVEEILGRPLPDRWGRVG